MSNKAFNLDKLREEFGAPPILFSLSVKDRTPTEICISAQQNWTNGRTLIGFLHGHSLSILDSAYSNKSLRDFLTFDQDVEKNLKEIPYGIFVKDGELYVSNSSREDCGVLCGFIDRVYTSKEANEIKIKFLRALDK